jgi:uncharacterized protein with GYD domain
MALYLYEAAYTGESWATQLSKRENVAERVRPLVRKLGGDLKDVWYAFGEYDVVGLLDLPTPEAAAAFSLAISKGGSVKTSKTTPLLSVEQGLEAMKLAGDASGTYRAPVTA